MRATLLGPIFGAEMLTGARRLRFFLSRAAYGVLLLVLLWANYSPSTFGTDGFDTSNLSISQVAQFSSNFFGMFSFLQLSAVLLVSPAALGSLLARERERRTIEYLFATDLSNREIVLGKFAAGWCYVAALLMTGLPVLALVMMMGGIPPSALLAVFSITLSTSLFVAALAILVSACSRRARDGVTQTYLLMLFVFLGPYCVEWWVVDALRDYYEGPMLDAASYALSWLMAINPFSVLNSVVSGGAVGVFSGRGSLVVEQLICGQLVGAALALLVATWSVRRVHLRSASAGVSAKRTWSFHGRRPAVGPRGMLWKELFTERISGRRGLIARIGILLLVLAAVGLTIYNTAAAFDSGNATFESRQSAAYANLVIGTIVSCALLLIVAIRASTAIGSERERDTWVSLLCTPLSAAEILWSKLVGCLFAVRWVCALLLLNWLATIVLVPGFMLSIPFLASSLAVLAPFAAALGLFFSLWCRNTTRALIATLAVSFVIGGGYGLCCGCMTLPFTYSGNDLTAELFPIVVLAPLVPFLLAYPGVVGIAGADADSSVNIPLAYLLGTAMYLGATAALLAFIHQRFEKLAGRIDVNDKSMLPRALVSDPSSRISADRAPRGA